MSDEQGRAQIPYGHWPSPITPDMLTQGAVGLVDVWTSVWDGEPCTVWLESRPSEAGRLQLVALAPDGTRRDLLPDGFSARSGVHEYGGGAAWVEVGVAWFVNWSDQRLYRLTSGSAPVALTPEPVEPRSLRYADMRLSPDGNWLVGVRESHGTDHQVTNEVVMLRAAEPSEPVVVFAVADFVANPRFVADDRVRWVAWDHPNMPWNDTSLYEASFDAATGAVGSPNCLAGGESLMQPVGEYVISDRSNWWNVWRISSTGEATSETPLDAEMSGPAWVFGERDYVVAADGRVAFAIGPTVYVDGAAAETSLAAIDHWTLAGTTVTAIGRFTDRDAEIIRFDLANPAGWQTVVAGRTLPLTSEDLATPEPIEFPTVDGAPNAYGWFYAPTNASVAGPADERPPLVVMIHGGPTSDSVPFFSLAKQFWTSRGFAVVDVNHRGSTGFGRDFRNLLDGQWGIVDVEDCCAAASWLAAQGLVDPAKMVIRGGSAGGFTVLASMAFADVFAAGASSYGVADLAVLAADTHKFEARYCDRLIGPWPAAHDVYEARSPIHHLDGFDRPLIVFQGLDDMVVPPNQSEMIVAALRAKGVECEYHAYAGEGHGFRQAATIVASLTAELGFYQRILN
jgi:dipeptidyl aminopeptidase/acylaminoacyl peptidase